MLYPVQSKAKRYQHVRICLRNFGPLKAVVLLSTKILAGFVTDPSEFAINSRDLIFWGRVGRQRPNGSPIGSDSFRIRVGDLVRQKAKAQVGIV
jgi:hypothetical protein